MAFVDLTTLGLETYGVHTFKRSPKRTARRTIHVQAPNGDVLEAQWTLTNTVWFYKNGKELFTDVLGTSWPTHGTDNAFTYSGGTPVVIVGRRAYYGVTSAARVSRSTRIHVYVKRFDFDSGEASTIYQVDNWLNSGATNMVPINTAVQASAIAYNPADKHLYVMFSGWARAKYILSYQKYLSGLYKISLEGTLEDTLWSTTGTTSELWMSYPCVAVEGDYVYVAYSWTGAPRVWGVSTAGGTPTTYVSESSGQWRVGPHGLIAYGLSLRAVAKATETVSHTWDMSSYCTDLSLTYVLQKKAAGSYLLLAWTGGLLKLFELKSDETVVELSSRSLSSFGLPAGYNLGGLELEDSYPALPQKAFFSTGRETFEATRPGWEVI